MSDTHLFWNNLRKHLPHSANAATSMFDLEDAALRYDDTQRGEHMHVCRVHVYDDTELRPTLVPYKWKLVVRLALKHKIIPL